MITRISDTTSITDRATVISSKIHPKAVVQQRRRSFLVATPFLLSKIHYLNCHALADQMILNIFGGVGNVGWRTGSLYALHPKIASKVYVCMEKDHSLRPAVIPKVMQAPINTGVGCPCSSPFSPLVFPDHTATE
eukprot:gene21136-biopygen7160